ncbi:MAG: UvrD-helicase domain-containing protein, partial [candidate division KSB1 bacterium]|nr:UvrD-helicase domain-containing protein [candidate division KSB1 bacterium]
MILRELNPVQREAVECTDGPVLILAGAGSGKTRVLTHKVAYLIDIKKVAPWTILAMTFTNKAAGEMKDRITKLTKRAADSIWMGTFHSIFARILRREGQRMGLERNFVIYDTDDQLALVKEIMNDLQISQQNFSPGAIHHRISGAKNALVSPEAYARSAADRFEEKVALVYEHYQNRLHQNNALDFDDLLVKPIELFQTYPPVLEQYQERFHYILVDEYQDTNRAQYVLIKLLSAKFRNICVVGDDDQSIYRWRGADIRNILDFERDFPDCKIFRLEQNYRSTKNILAAANSVVKQNLGRMEKTLWTQKEQGEKVTVLDCWDGYDESLKIVETIQEEFYKHKRNFKDFAILYRTNAQSRILEEGLRDNGISYVIVGGVRFYERKEVKDVLAYLRLIINPWDTISLKRIINYPLRGIGTASISKVEKLARSKNITLFEALGRVHEVEELSERIKTNMSNFYKLISKYRNLREKISANELARALVDEIGLLRMFKEEGTQEAQNRYENIQELLSAIAEFSKRHEAPT